MFLQRKMLFVLLLFDLWKAGRGKLRHTKSCSIIILLQKGCQKIDRVSVLRAWAGGMRSDTHWSTGVGMCILGGIRKTLLVCNGPYGLTFRKLCVWFYAHLCCLPPTHSNLKYRFQRQIAEPILRHLSRGGWFSDTQNTCNSYLKNVLCLLCWIGLPERVQAMFVKYIFIFYTTQ